MILLIVLYHHRREFVKLKAATNKSSLRALDLGVIIGRIQIITEKTRNASGNLPTC